MKATIFNIQKFSIHDGPGIRTVVFFKGCPLHCAWCSNPESQSTHIELTYNPSVCQHCLTCLHQCPTQAITHIQNKIHFDPKKCTLCFQCIKACPMQAIDKEGEDKEIEEIVQEVLKDVPFYEESGGGVTFSGGEFLSQPKAASELARQLKTYHLHLACETTGFCAHDTFKEVIAPFDLLLFDMKHHDPKKHKRYTGVSNDLIIKNLTYAIEQGKDVIARIPVIPHVNDDLADARQFTDLLQTIGIKQVDLLPFHQFGQNKYDLLDQSYIMKDVPALHPEDLKDYQQVFLDRGFDCHL